MTNNGSFSSRHFAKYHALCEESTRSGSHIRKEFCTKCTSSIHVMVMDPLGWTVQASQNLKSTADWCSDTNGTELWVSGTYHHFICLLAYFKLLSNTDLCSWWAGGRNLPYVHNVNAKWSLPNTQRQTANYCQWSFEERLQLWFFFKVVINNELPCVSNNAYKINISGMIVINDLCDIQVLI